MVCVCTAIAAASRERLQYYTLYDYSIFQDETIAVTACVWARARAHTHAYVLNLRDRVDDGRVCSGATKTGRRHFRFIEISYYYNEYTAKTGSPTTIIIIRLYPRARPGVIKPHDITVLRGKRYISFGNKKEKNLRTNRLRPDVARVADSDRYFRTLSSFVVQRADGTVVVPARALRRWISRPSVPRQRPLYVPNRQKRAKDAKEPTGRVRQPIITTRGRPL